MNMREYLPVKSLIKFLKRRRRTEKENRARVLELSMPNKNEPHRKDAQVKHI